MLGNFQGQPLTPIQRGLDRSQSGFAVLLNSIQGVANRVVENKKVAEQRDWVERRDKELYERELEKAEFVQGLQQKSELEVLQQRTAAQRGTAVVESQLRQQEVINKMALESTPEALDLRRRQNYMDSLGSSQGRAGERDEVRRQNKADAENELNESFLATLKEYPALRGFGFQPVVTDDGLKMVSIFDPVDNEQKIISFAAYNDLVAGEAAKKDIVSEVVQQYNTNNYDVVTRQGARDIQARYNQGGYASIEDLQTDLNRLNIVPLDSAQITEAMGQARKAGNAVLSKLQSLNLQGENPDWLKPLTQGKQIFSRDSVRLDTDIQGILSAQGTTPAEKIGLLADYITRNYASVEDISKQMSTSTELKDGNPDAVQFQQYLNVITTAGATAGISGGPIYLNPFAPAESVTNVSTPKNIAVDIYRRFGSMTPTTEQVTQQSSSVIRQNMPQ